MTVQFYKKGDRSLCEFVQQGIRALSFYVYLVLEKGVYARINPVSVSVVIVLTKFSLSGRPWNVDTGPVGPKFFTYSKVASDSVVEFAGGVCLRMLQVQGHCTSAR